MLKPKKPTKQISTCEYINLADIRANFLYTKDNYIYQFLKVMPISTALMTEDEKAHLTFAMSKELSPIGVPFKILFLSRPTDITKIIEYYEGVRSMTGNTKKRDNLKKTMNYLSAEATSGGILERQTFIALWIDKNTQGEEELYSKATEFKNALNNTGVVATICTETEITNIVSLFYDPVFSTVNYDKTPNFTFLGGLTNG